MDDAQQAAMALTASMFLRTASSTPAKWRWPSFSMAWRPYGRPAEVIAVFFFVWEGGVRRGKTRVRRGKTDGYVCLEKIDHTGGRPPARPLLPTRARHERHTHTHTHTRTLSPPHCSFHASHGLEGRKRRKGGTRQRAQRQPRAGGGRGGGGDHPLRNDEKEGGEGGGGGGAPVCPSQVPPPSLRREQKRTSKDAHGDPARPPPSRARKI